MPSVTIDGFKVDFPFQPYEPQNELMRNILRAVAQRQNALLESPTGTGKTLAVLCALLSFRRSLVDMHDNTRNRDQAQTPAFKSNTDFSAPSLPRIIYSSRTHAQLRQVMRELKRTVHRPTVCVLGSREQLCVHSSVKDLRGGQQTAACQALISADGCVHYKSVQTRKQKGTLLNPDALRPEAERQLPDIEDFINEASRDNLCPFYFARELQHSAEILFVPYNYLLNGRTREALKIDLENAIIVLDEGHNVEQVCADSASFDLGPLDFSGAARELERLVENVRGRAEQSIPGNPVPIHGSEQAAIYARLRDLVLEMENLVQSVKLKPDGRGGSPRYTAGGHNFLELLTSINITQGTFAPLIETCAQASKELAESAKWGGSVSGAYVQRWADALTLVFNTEQHPPAEYRMCIEEERSSRKRPRDGPVGRTLGYWCCNPGVGMRALAQSGARSIILTSGTLSPLNSFAAELGIPFQHQLENSHVIASEQLLVGVVPFGPSGLELTSTFQHRESDKYKAELGSALVNIARLVPQGILVFFPSYAALQSATARWEESGADGSPSIMERLRRQKLIVVEPRDRAALVEAVEAYKSHIAMCERTGIGGAMLFAVCRGRLSEGVDFADAACRAVIVTGLPLPPIYDAKVALKRAYLEDRSRAAPFSGNITSQLTGNDWYDQQAMRAVNQALGRVIRHVHDYGIVLLFESRFRKTRYVDCLSQWLHPHMRQFDNFGQVNQAIPGFFRNMTLANKKSSRALPNESNNSKHEEIQVTAAQKVQGTQMAIANWPQAIRTEPVKVSAAAPSLFSVLREAANQPQAEQKLSDHSFARPSSITSSSENISKHHACKESALTAQQVLNTAKSKLNSADYGLLLDLLRGIKKVQNVVARDDANSASAVDPSSYSNVRTLCGNLFDNGRNAEVASLLCPLIPLGIRKHLPSLAQSSSNITSFERLREGLLRVPQTFTALNPDSKDGGEEPRKTPSKTFKQKLDQALVGSRVSAEYFKSRMKELLLELKSIDPNLDAVQKQDKAGHVLQKLYSHFTESGLQSLRNELSVFVPWEYGGLWSSILRQ